MKKVHELRAYLTEWVPELKTDPSRLLVHVDSGRVEARYGVNLGWEYHYRANLTVLNYTKHQDTLFLPLVVWLRNHMPDIILNFEKGSKAITFQVDIMDGATVDISISIDLHESVDVLPVQGGRYDMSHRDEPAIVGSEGAEGLAQLPDDVLLLINPYGDYLLGKTSDLLMSPGG